MYTERPNTKWASEVFVTVAPTFSNYFTTYCAVNLLLSVTVTTDLSTPQTRRYTTL